jgi:hypothetical protein
MILVFEMTWPGDVHVPGNSVTLQTIAAAWPLERVRMFADAGHIAALRQDAALAAHGNVEFHPVALYPHLFGKTHLVSWGRFRQEFRTLRHALAAVPRGESCLLMLISATPTAILAARLAARMARTARRRVAVQVGLHGNLNDINGWRPRNPLARGFDLRAMLSARQPPWLRYLVLEAGIADALADALPGLAGRVQVLPHPIILGETAGQSPLPLAPPIRIGLVGQATKAKGIELFLELARDLRARHGDRVAFTLVGTATVGSDLAMFDVLDEPVTIEALPRSDYVARLARLHYVLLPLQERYYRLSASGALLDAITWLKPVIATRLPITEALFREFGDIGTLCDDADALRAAVESVVAAPDPARYQRQVAAMRAVRDSRAPAALAAAYRTMLRHDMPGLLHEQERNES